jgi:hypothetical protein
VCTNEGDRVGWPPAATMMDEVVPRAAICGEDTQLHGMLTDRDIVIKVLAKRFDTCRSRPDGGLQC